MHPGRLLLLLIATVLPMPAQPTLPATPVRADHSLPTGEGAPTVVLLHGLGLGSWAMRRVGAGLARDGYRVINLSYDSLRVPLAELSSTWLTHQLAAHQVDLNAGAPPLYFVTHSMGGIVLRGWLQHHGVPAPLRRVVMFAPPNHGSTLVDRIGHWWAFRLATGVNGRELSTAADSVPNRLPPWPAGPELGIIAGNRPINPLLAYWTGGPGDGKVRVEHTRLAGMTDHLVLPYSHTWIQYRTPAIDQARAFLRAGHFEPVPAP